MSIAKRFRAQRLRSKATLKYVADYCEASVSYVSDIEHGRRGLTIDMARRMALGLGMNPLKCIEELLQEWIDEGLPRFDVKVRLTEVKS